MSKNTIKVVSGIPSGKYLSIPKTEKPPLKLQKPTFRLVCCDSRKYCLGRSKDKNQLVGFATTLHHLSQMSWQDIEYGDRLGSGSEKLNFMRRRIPQNLTVPSDVDIFGIKYWENKRLVGYKDADNAFCIIWVDDGTLYKHG